MRAEGMNDMNAEGIRVVMRADGIFITEKRINIRAGGISMGTDGIAIRTEGIAMRAEGSPWEQKGSL